MNSKMKKLKVLEVSKNQQKLIKGGNPFATVSQQVSIIITDTEEI